MMTGRTQTKGVMTWQGQGKNPPPVHCRHSCNGIYQRFCLWEYLHHTGSNLPNMKPPCTCTNRTALFPGPGISLCSDSFALLRVLIIQLRSLRTGPKPDGSGLNLMFVHSSVRVVWQFLSSFVIISCVSLYNIHGNAMFHRSCLLYLSWRFIMGCCQQPLFRNVAFVVKLRKAEAMKSF